MNEKQAFINTCLANNATSQKRLDELKFWYDEFERQALYTAIASNNAAIESAKAAYASSLAIVNTTADAVLDRNRWRAGQRINVENGKLESDLSRTVPGVPGGISKQFSNSF